MDEDDDKARVEGRINRVLYENAKALYKKKDQSVIGAIRAQFIKDLEAAGHDPFQEGLFPKRHAPANNVIEMAGAFGQEPRWQ